MNGGSDPAPVGAAPALQNWRQEDEVQDRGFSSQWTHRLCSSQEHHEVIMAVLKRNTVICISHVGTLIVSEWAHFGQDQSSFSQGTGTPTSSSSHPFPGIAPMLGTCIPALNDLPKLMILFLVIGLCHLLFWANKAFSFFLHETPPCLKCPLSPQGLVSRLSSLVFSSPSAEKGGVELNSAPGASVCWQLG